jgi:hypothetical protein
MERDIDHIPSFRCRGKADGFGGFLLVSEKEKGVSVLRERYVILPGSFEVLRLSENRTGFTVNRCLDP